MLSYARYPLVLLFALSTFSVGAAQVQSPAAPAGEDAKAEPQVLELADGKLLLPVPGAWKKVEPRSRIIQHEFSVAAAKGDENPGRMTIMAASGGVEANINRWIGQFQTADGKPLGDDAKKIEEKKIGEQVVHLVDLTGTFQDSPRGPFGPKVARHNYSMLAAIVPVKDGGTWFIKLYGPQATIKAAEKGFEEMIAGVSLKQ